VDNGGSTEAIANCRVTRDGAPRADDIALRTPPVPANGSITMSRVLPVPDQPPRYNPLRLTVTCS
jgi:hypothetical protein